MDLKNLHHWDVLALSCIDGRFTKRAIEFVGRKAGNVFDYRTEVGCTKAIIDSELDRTRFFNVVHVALRLHSIKEIWLIDHMDCGAYGGSKEHSDCDTEKEFHITKLDEAAKIITAKFPQITVKKFYADFENIELV